MKNGFKILWTNNALNELEKTIKYLEENLTEKELKTLALRLENILILILENPRLFQSSGIKKDLRRVVFLKHNTLYYRLKEDKIEIISFFSNRQNPNKRKLK